MTSSWSLDDDSLMVRAWIGALLIGLTLQAGAQAGGWAERKPYCPRSEYSRLNYWTPSLWRIQAHVPRQVPYIYAPDNYPNIPINNQPTVFPCQSVNPSDRPYPDGLNPSIEK